MDKEQKDGKIGPEGNRNLGGRPRKAEVRNIVLTLKCSAGERRRILERAATAALSVSEYLREIALKGHIEMRSRALPSEVLELNRYLGSIAGSLNQIAKRANIGMLGPMERADLKVQALELKQLAGTVKNWLK